MMYSDCSVLDGHVMNVTVDSSYCAVTCWCDFDVWWIFKVFLGVLFCTIKSCCVCRVQEFLNSILPLHHRPVYASNCWRYSRRIVKGSTCARSTRVNIRILLSTIHRVVNITWPVGVATVGVASSRTCLNCFESYVWVQLKQQAS